MTNLLQGIPVLSQSGRPGDIVKVEAKGILRGPLAPVPSVVIDRIEYCFDQRGRLTDVIYRLVEGKCDWGFVEIGLESASPAYIHEARIMRKVHDAPSIESDVGAIVYGDATYVYKEHGVSDVLLLTVEKGLRRDIKMSWVAFDTNRRRTGLVRRLVYAEWKGGSGVYWGYLIPIESVSILMKIADPEEVSR